MEEYLVPLNYHRAYAVLRELEGYTSWSEEGARRAVDALRRAYPLIFSRMEEKTFAGGAVLLEMSGCGICDPLLFLSHLDAPFFEPLPMEEAPVSVALSRAHLISLLEALEELFKTPYRPSGDLILCLSADGLSGGRGAEAMAQYLRRRGVKPTLALDYGGYVTKESFLHFVPGDTKIAFVGIAEKGEWLGTLTAAVTDPGDRSKPAEEVIRAGSAFTRGANLPFLCEASEKMLRALGGKAPMPQKLVISSPKLFFPLMCLFWRKRSVFHQFFLSERRVSSLNARGGVLSVPGEATLTFRQTILPGQKTAALKASLKHRAKRNGAELTFLLENPATACAETTGPGWDAIGTAIEIEFERSLVLPCLCPFPTDSRYFADFGVYRFSPFLLSGRQALKGKCTLEANSLQAAVQFFRAMLSV